MPVSPDLRRELGSALESLESVRLEYLAQHKSRKRWLYLALFLLFVAGVGVGYSVLDGSPIPASSWVFVGVSVIGVIAAAIYVGTHSHKFQRSFKDNAYCTVVEALRPGMNYDPHSHVSAADFRASKLFGNYDRYNGDDYFSGYTSNGSYVEFSELHVEEEHESHDSDGGSSSSHTNVFKGLFFVLETPYQGQRRVCILPDTAERNLGFIGKWIQKNLSSWFQSGDMVYFEEHPEFEREFVVYSEEEHKARAVLTLPILEAIYDLKYRWKESVRLSFVNNKIYLALSLNTDLFNVDMHTSVLGDGFLQRLVGELDRCFDMLECLSALGDSSESDSSDRLRANPFTQSDQPPKSGVSYRKSSSKDNPFLL